MNVFSVSNENIIAAHAAEEVPKGSATFSNETELAKLTASWPTKRLVDIWNRLPGVAAVSKFTDRKTAARRIWQAVSATEAAGKQQPAGAAREVDRKTKGKAKAAPTPQPLGTKTERIIALLKRPEGATLKAIMSATGWQAHSVRGFISAQLTKRMGLKVKSFKRDGERCYRLR